MRYKSILVSFLILFIVWFLLNNTFDLIVLGVGVFVSLFIAILFCRNCELFSELKFTPKAFFYTIIYLCVFLIELIKSNLDVAFRVVSPSLPINPGMVEVKTKLKSKMARMILANSISLTPGTLTVKIEDDKLLIHWIDVKSTDIDQATKDIVSKFDNYLIKIYG